MKTKVTLRREEICSGDKNSLKMKRVNYFLYLTVVALCVVIETGGIVAQTNHSANYTIDEQQSLISRYISINEFFKDLNAPQFQESCESLLYHVEELDNKTTFSELNRRTLESKAYLNFFSDLQIQRYDSFAEMKQSGGPQVDNELCLRQLEHLIERSKVMMREKYDSKDINLAQLLDTYGKEPSGRFLGNIYWPGAYEECLRLTIKTPDDEQVPTRYCIAHMRDKRWAAQDSPVSLMTAMKSGIYLPKSCDSLRYKNKYDLVFELNQINIRELEKNELYLSDLYCLPDSASPLRTWWKQPKPLMVFLAFLSWILLVLYATFRFDSKDEQRNNTFLRTFSITSNLRLLFDVKKTSSLLQTDTNIRNEAPADSHVRDIQQAKRTKQLVDLRILEGIKVIAMFYVIAGHLILTMFVLVGNERDLVLYFSPIFFLANQAAAVTVNAFFTITGILTCYLLFKHNQLSALNRKPLKWVAFVMYRYARIMPVYVLAVAYSKYLAKFFNSGPFWDYGTSSLGIRRICEQESWLWTLLFGANFKITVNHCSPAAGWYLADDFQFFLVTPIFLSLLYSRPKLGQWLICVCMILSYLVSVASIYSAELDDLRSIARFMPHGLKAYMINLNASYTQPQNRINVYLFGLLLGYYLHLYEKNKLEYRATQGKSAQLGGKIFHGVKAEPDWPPLLRKYGCLLSALILIGYNTSPIVAPYVPFNKYWARMCVSLLMPSYNLIFSLAIGVYIILAATGGGSRRLNSFLSAPFWKPLARLSLCVLLTHLEVLYNLVGSRTQTMFMDTFSHLGLIIQCTIYCYLVGIVVCVFFEAPIRATLGHVLSFALSKSAADESKKSSPPVQV